MDTLLQFLNSNLLVILAGAVGGFLGLLLANKELEKILRLLRTSTAEIGTLSADEQVQVVGQADGQTTLTSPITKKACVLWQAIVSEKRSSGRSSHWVTVYSRTSTEPFEVYDLTGRMRVYPGHTMELLLKDDLNKVSSIFNTLDEQTQAALKEAGLETKGFLNMNKTIRIQERYIERGDQIYVLGKTSASQGARVMDTQSPLIVSDHSQLRLLGTFFGQVFWNVLIGVLLGIGLGRYLVDR
jgi:E3 ubiquitin ligase